MRSLEHALQATGAYGISVPSVRNVMKQDAYTFLRRYVHFCDNDEKKESGKAGYDQLFKVAYVLETIGRVIRIPGAQGNA